MSFGKEQYRWESLLGALIAQKDPYFEKIACMNDDWREIIGLLEVLKIVSPEDKDLIKDIDTLLIPIVQRMGQAEWTCDIVTHLAMKLKSVRKISDAK